MKNQGNRTNVGQEDAITLTGIAPTYIEFPSAHFFNCYGVLFFYFSLVNFIFNLALPAIFITQLSHSRFPFSFVVEALMARVRCMTARDRLRAWDVKFFGSSNLTHKRCGIFVASWGFAHCIGTRLVFHNFFISP